MTTDPLERECILQIALILLNFFITLAYHAVISLGKSELDELSDKKTKKSKIILKLADEETKLLSFYLAASVLIACAAGAFAANDLNGMLAKAIYSLDFFKDEGFAGLLSIIVIIIATAFLHVVFGKFIPRKIAEVHSYKAVKITCRFLRAIYCIMIPFSYVANIISFVVLKIFGVKLNSDNEAVTEDEIMMLMDKGEESGTIETEEKKMIENIFDFGNLTAADVMTHRVDIKYITPEQTREEIVELISSSGFSRFPVCGEDINDIKGILNTRDYLLNLRKDKPKTIEEMLRTPFYIPETAHADALFRSMQQDKKHIAIVVDEYGATSGILTMEDLLEEIVGNIYDEFDSQEEESAVQIEEGVWKIPGNTEISELEEIFNIEFDEDTEFDTLSGLILSQLDTIPESGTSLDIEAYGLKIHIDAFVGRKVDEAIVTKIISEETEQEEH